jgi:exodeoxyribonuclease VII small subunit
MATQRKYKDYETAMERLEEITEQLEAGDPKLEDAIKLYTEGLEIAKFCTEKLDDAESKIKLIAEKNDRFEEEEFEEEV